MATLKDLYFGSAGELRVASEMLLRGYVAHIPTMDEGGDLFVVREDSGTTIRVQVKAAAERRNNNLPNVPAYQFNLKTLSLNAPFLSKGKNKLLFAFLLFDGTAKQWRETLVIPARTLNRMSPTKQGAPTKTIWIYRHQGELVFGGIGGCSVQRYCNSLPRFFPPVVSRSSI